MKERADGGNRAKERVGVKVDRGNWGASVRPIDLFKGDGRVWRGIGSGSGVEGRQE